MYVPPVICALYKWAQAMWNMVERIANVDKAVLLAPGDSHIARWDDE